MACNNTYTARDARRASAGVAAPAHPTTGGDALDRAFVEALFRDRYAKYDEAEVARRALMIQDFAAHKSWFQELGENYVMHGWLMPMLRISPTGYEPAKHGADEFGLSAEGDAVVFEVKAWRADPPLSRAVSQVGPERVDKDIDSMTRSGGEQATRDNPGIAAFVANEGYEGCVVLVGYANASVRVYRTHNVNGRPVADPEPFIVRNLHDVLGGADFIFYPRKE